MVNKKEFLLSEESANTSSVNSDDRMVQNNTQTQTISSDHTLLDSFEHHHTKKIASLRLMIPVYLDNQLTQIAASKRVTKRFLILQALAKSGYHIEKEDLVTDKRKIR